MEWLTNNWFFIVVAVGFVAVVVVTVINFIKLPNAQKISNVKEWLKYAVTEAEKALGAKTGQLKLRMVYDLAVKQFPWIVSMVSFDTFSAWVDEALEWLNKQLSSNDQVKAIVEGGKDA